MLYVRYRHHAAVVCSNNRENVSTNNLNKTSNNFVSHRENIGMLQTAQANVSDVNGRNSTTLRILFDSGSQLSYITEEAKKRLHLQAIEKSEVLIKTFGNRDDSKTLEKVRFCVKGKNGISVYVTALTSEICTPISGQFVDFTKHSYSHLRDLELADSNPSGKGLEVDIVIGSDFYWSFMSGNIVKSESGCGPVALDSILGYVLSGQSRVPFGARSTNVNFGEIVVLHVGNENKTLHTNLNQIWESETMDVEEEESEVFAKFKKT